MGVSFRLFQAPALTIGGPILTPFLTLRGTQGSFLSNLHFPVSIFANALI